jgi:hypothetical protein
MPAYLRTGGERASIFSLAASAFFLSAATARRYARSLYVAFPPGVPLRLPRAEHPPQPGDVVLSRPPHVRKRLVRQVPVHVPPDRRQAVGFDARRPHVVPRRAVGDLAAGAAQHLRDGHAVELLGIAGEVVAEGVALKAT